MRHQMPLAASIIWRRSKGFAIVEIPLMGVVATIVLFFGGLAMKRPVDGAMFFARSSFDTVAVVAPDASSGTATFADVMPRFPVVRAPDADETLAFTPDLQTVELDVVDDVGIFATQVLGSNVESSEAGPGAYVDEDTARRLGVSLGGAIVLDSAALGGQESSPIRVVGIIAPYTSPRNHHETGLVVVSRTLVGDRLIPEATELLPPTDGPFRRIYGTPQNTPDVAPRTNLVANFLGDLVGRDAIMAMAGIVIFAGLLWLAAAWRATDLAIRRSSATAALLVALGGQPRTVRWAILGPEGALIFGAQLLGATVVAGVIFPSVLASGLQPLALLPMFFVLSVCTLLVLGVSFAGVALSVSRESLLNTLVSPDE